MTAQEQQHADHNEEMLALERFNHRFNVFFAVLGTMTLFIAIAEFCRKS